MWRDAAARRAAPARRLHAEDRPDRAVSSASPTPCWRSRARTPGSLHPIGGNRDLNPAGAFIQARPTTIYGGIHRDPARHHREERAGAVGRGEGSRPPPPRYKPAHDDRVLTGRSDLPERGKHPRSAGGAGRPRRPRARASRRCSWWTPPPTPPRPCCAPPCRTCGYPAQLLSLSRNFGAFAAIRDGLAHARGRRLRGDGRRPAGAAGTGARPSSLRCARTRPTSASACGGPARTPAFAASSPGPTGGSTGAS